MPNPFLPSLSETLKLKASVFFRLQLAAPWGLALPEEGDLRVHVVTQGSCWLGGHGLDRPLKLDQGQIALLTHGKRHWIADRPGSTLMEGDVAIEGCATGDPPFQSGPKSHRLICGQANIRDQGGGWLLQLMPAVLQFKADDLTDRIWKIVEAIGAGEASLADDDAHVLDRLTEALFLSLLSRALELQLETGPLGTAYREPQLRKVLTLLHSEFEQPWTLEELAKRAAMSRPTLARRFKAILGLPVMGYLTRVRMAEASRLLVAGENLDTIAHRTGYGSAEAVRKAFKRHTGMTPASYVRDVLSQP